MIDWNLLVAQKGVGAVEGQSRPGHDAWGYKPAVSASSELRRVLGLPRRELELDGSEHAEAIIDQAMARYGRPVIPGRRCRCAELDPERHREEGCIERLRLPQAQALREIGICGGLLGPIGVGHGKTLIDLLGTLAFQKYDKAIRDVVLLVPSSLAAQLADDYVYYGQHFKMPQIVFHGINYKNTLTHLDTRVPLDRDANTVHVVKYEILSRPESTVWLERELKPQAIIADECHKLRTAGLPLNKGATGGRVWRWMEEIAPQTKFVGLSGSMTAKRVQDYWHLAKWALRGGSPLPTELGLVDEWGTALNPSDNPADPGDLMGLCAPGEHLYAGFKRRVAETLGVVTTAAPSVDVDLVLLERKAPPIPADVAAALRELRNNQVRPDGEELLTALEVASCAMQLAFGFYYRWIYPDCEFPRDEQLVLDWRAARKAYFRDVRTELKNPREHLDSPRLIMNAVERHYGVQVKRKGLPTLEMKSFLPWNRLKGLVRAETEAVCFNDYIIRDVAAWMHENGGGPHEGGIVWYEFDALGEWIRRVSGLPKYGGGKDMKAALKREDGCRSVAASAKAHGTGTNGLQHRFHKCFLMHISPDPNAVEQQLGREHRPGQSHNVEAYFYRHTPELKKHIDDAITAAYYVEGTGFGVQKIIRAYRE